MSEIDTGGPAFPTNRINIHGEVVPDEEGMTLRDYFAAKAMQALLAQNFGGAVRDEMLAGFAYAMADAMLKERNK